MLEIFKKEMRSFFVTPIGYIVLIIYYFLSSLYFCFINLTNMIVSLSYVFQFETTWLLLFSLPMLTMRLLAEERRMKTDQMLLTAPISVGGIVMGKYLSAMCIFFFCSLINVVFRLIAVIYSGSLYYTSDFFCDYLGMLLVGAAIIAVDLFLSALADNQLIAAFGAIGVNVLFLLTRSLANSVSAGLPQFLIMLISPYSWYQTYFEKGMLSLAAVFYYISFAALFLFLTTQVVEKRRWS